MVEFGKMWQIENKADFEKAMAALDEAKFIAEMSDDFSCWRRRVKRG